MATTYIAAESHGSWGGSPRTASNQYIQDAIDSGSAGDTYILQSGTHRGQQFTLASGDELLMATGAILNGCEDIGTGGWSDEGGNVWSKAVSGLGGRAPGSGNPCQGGFNCDDMEVMVIDGLMYPWYDSNVTDADGCYHDGSVVYIGVDPSSVSTIEIARAEYINGAAAKLAGETLAERAKIYGYACVDYNNGTGGIEISGTNPTMENLDIYAMAGCAVVLQDDLTLTNVTIHHNGQMGLGGGGSDGATIGEGCYVYNNGIGGWNNGWEGGNCKMDDTLNLTVKGSLWDIGTSAYIDGLGPYWMDINNDGYHVFANLFMDTSHEGSRGAFFEISYSGKIHDNICYELSWDSNSRLFAGGIFFSGTGAVPGTTIYDEVEVYNNLIYRCSGGIHLVMDRGDDYEDSYAWYNSPTGWLLQYIDVFDNTVWLTGEAYSNFTGEEPCGVSDDESGAWDEPAGITFERNRYLVDSDESRFQSEEDGGSGEDRSWAQWNATGHDDTGSHTVAGDYDPDPFNGGAM